MNVDQASNGGGGFAPTAARGEGAPQGARAQAGEPSGVMTGRRRRGGGRAASPAAAEPSPSTNEATDLREPSPADVAAADERRRPDRVQLCLSYPACGGPRTCLDCRRPEDGPEEPASAGGALTTVTQIALLRFLLEEVLHGLEGKPFLWSETRRAQYVPALRAAGVELVTEVQAKKRGHLLKSRAKPVGRISDGMPVRITQLFVMHVQTKAAPAKDGKAAAAQGGTT